MAQLYLHFPVVAIVKETAEAQIVRNKETLCTVHATGSGGDQTGACTVSFLFTSLKLHFATKFKKTLICNLSMFRPFKHFFKKF